jgi:hypothetical protein
MDDEALTLADLALRVSEARNMWDAFWFAPWRLTRTSSAKALCNVRWWFEQKLGLETDHCCILENDMTKFFDLARCIAPGVKPDERATALVCSMGQELRGRDPHKVARSIIARARRRAHQVRGHWRRDWRHEGNRIWIKEHQRGDASLGFVTHDYTVKHEPEHPAS